MNGVKVHTTKRNLLLLASVALALARAAEGHHSQSEFDLRSTVAVEGTVTKVEWKSPHARLYVDAKGENGEVVSWDLELPSPNTLMRRGWKRDSLKPGDYVNVTASPANRALITLTLSARRSTRAAGRPNGIPSAAYSLAFQPAPRPRSRRPSETRSSVAAAA